MFLPKCFRTYFLQVIPNSDDFIYNVAQKKFYAHADKKLEGTSSGREVDCDFEGKKKEILRRSNGQ